MGIYQQGEFKNLRRHYCMKCGDSGEGGMNWVADLQGCLCVECLRKYNTANRELRKERAESRRYVLTLAEQTHEELVALQA